MGGNLMSAFDPKRTFLPIALCLRRSVENGLKLAPLVGYPLKAIFSRLERGRCTQSKTRRHGSGARIPSGCAFAAL